MYPSGIIYDSNELKVSDFKHGEIIHKYRLTNLHPTLGRKVSYFIARSTGAGLLAFAVVFFIFTLGPLV